MVESTGMPRKGVVYGSLVLLWNAGLLKGMPTPQMVMAIATTQNKRKTLTGLLCEIDSCPVVSFALTFENQKGFNSLLWYRENAKQLIS